jgi:hypothetical protein
LTGTGFVGSDARSNERNRSTLGLLPLVLARWDVAERFVQAGGVVPADVLDDGELELGAGAPDAVGDQQLAQLPELPVPGDGRLRIRPFVEGNDACKWTARAGTKVVLVTEADPAFTEHHFGGDRSGDKCVLIMDSNKSISVSWTEP